MLGEFPLRGIGQSRGLPGDLPLSASYRCWIEGCLPELSTWSRMAKLKHGLPKDWQISLNLALHWTKSPLPRDVPGFLPPPQLFQATKGEAHPSCIAFGSTGLGGGRALSTCSLFFPVTPWGSAFLYITKAVIRLEESFCSGRKSVGLRIDLPGMNPTSISS